MIFGIKEKSIILTNLYAANIPQRLKTGFVVQGHKCDLKSTNAFKNQLIQVRRQPCFSIILIDCISHTTELNE